MGGGVIRLYEYGTSVPYPSFFPSDGRRSPLDLPWVLALKEAGDLHLRTGERVFVTDQTSSDWYAPLKLLT